MRYFVLVFLTCVVGCESPDSGLRVVRLNQIKYRLADDSSRVYWQVPVSNYTTGVATVCIEPSVQVMAEENIDACKAKWGAAWVDHWIPANGAEWVSPAVQATANLQPGESRVMEGEIALPEKYHGKKISLLNRSACSAEGTVAGH